MYHYFRLSMLAPWSAGKVTFGSCFWIYRLASLLCRDLVVVVIKIQSAIKLNMLKTPTPKSRPKKFLANFSCLNFRHATFQVSRTKIVFCTNVSIIRSCIINFTNQQFVNRQCNYMKFHWRNLKIRICFIFSSCFTPQPSHQLIKFSRVLNKVFFAFRC